ncbi:5-formyltetrahydrofolate cyclo-ligase [Lacticaseibacillus sharpeae]|uniref:5-formyltetrahydrofolate cyclo-ligase n=1 Tax=Lacticaseibacillus sharpeae JCM 1186 = DSM 20505 TaxID=1291052 RepID=A0A0R1ZMI8_9LACO|nr:5-formyltetrahydrofolate cyclo-ligase [Lacticaseibacillus sharpeae]KRM56206.1 5-formyltetrahydrofolate cyclo-ligase [Lacticaseibacillus sharpeae JCM 1186 = DSM 20505]
MDKQSARGQQIAALKNYPQDLRATETAAIIAQLTALPAWQAAQTIATTISGPFEFGTAGVIAAAEKAGKAILLPRVMPKRQMAFMPYRGQDKLIRSKFGLLEPAYDEATMNNAPDLVVVPGLAYALDSHKRLGFGGGYYDRFLAQYTGTTVALALPIQAFDTSFWPEDEFDIALQHIITLH